MNNHKTSRVHLDPEFVRLLPPPTENDFAYTAEKVSKYGCTHPIWVWDNIVLTDHLLFRVCSGLQIPITTIQMHYLTRDDALFYTAKRIIESDLLSGYYKMYDLGAAYISLKKMLAPVYSGKREHPFPEHEDREHGNFDHGRTAVVASSIFHHNGRTMITYGRFRQAIDSIAYVCPEFATALLLKEIRAKIQDIMEISKLSKGMILKAYAELKRGTSVKAFLLNYFPSSCRQSIATKSLNPCALPGIKNMPAFDPDAEVSSLALTIPSWINSINRVSNTANFSIVTERGKGQLLEQMYNLSVAIQTIRKKMEDHHEQQAGNRLSEICTERTL